METSTLPNGTYNFLVHDSDTKKKNLKSTDLHNIQTEITQ